MARRIDTKSNNIYEYLEEGDFGMDIKDNTERKAKKKLKEIENLKKKDKKDLTDLEKEKIATEKYWKNIINPEKEEEKGPSKKEEQKRLKKEKERQKKEKQKKEEKKERKRKEKEELERQRQKEREEYQAKMNKHYEEWKKQQEEWKKQEQTKQPEPQKIVISEIETEYLRQLKKFNGNKDKVFRKLSLKYHPDRNIGNEKIANENQQDLLAIHKKYS